MLSSPSSTLRLQTDVGCLSSRSLARDAGFAYGQRPRPNGRSHVKDAIAKPSNSPVKLVTEPFLVACSVQGPVLLWKFESGGIDQTRNSGHRPIQQ